MDSLTQIVLGAAVGELVLGRKVGNKAMIYGAVAGTIPDLDVFIGNFYDTVTALEIHRGFSHSIVFSVLMAPVLGYLLSRIHKQASWKNWSSLVFFGLFTHPLLDCFTTWGTQLFWPLDLRIAFKSIFVIDPLYTLPFLICLIAASRYQRTSVKRRRLNRWGLIISSSYLILSLVSKGFAFDKFENALAAQNISYTELETRPSPLNILLWSANVKTSTAFLIGEYSIFDSQPIQFRAYPKQHEKIEGLLKYENLERLTNITKGWFIISERENELYFNDLRFGLVSLDPASEKFVFSYSLSEVDNELIITEEPKTREDVKALFSELWTRIKGN
ncbi:membrane-bound metal-dependent hydrolase [Psychroflexus gondwanensis ACAM 44]|uniref:Membrane-bound metal-dependent hydrolase n=1 Tax=Psychroflexus gondwanensis ACAM 44 TaxID=1189619 RepID=N1WUC2_9FLAO|nr:metal-dependent hydrolase [Psychroflexus gondwanensis]EMY80729.1 membrane-bound metal-dependent hydrolase [Psychroflexus gondwanensis ACAM 44]